MAVGFAGLFQHLSLAIHSSTHICESTGSLADALRLTAATPRERTSGPRWAARRGPDHPLNWPKEAGYGKIRLLQVASNSCPHIS